MLSLAFSTGVAQASHFAGACATEFNAVEQAINDAVSLAACGKRLSKQSFAILPWIREVDEALRAAPELRERVREAHPEISFYYLNGERPMAHSKKSGLGFLGATD